MKVFFSLCIGILLFPAVAHAKNPPQEQIKAYMYRFVGQAAELRMAEIKGDQPDWKQIQATLKKMKKTVRDMDRYDRAGKYRGWLKQLSGSVNQMEIMSMEKNPDIAAAYDKMTQKCLRCHTAHLPHSPLSFQEPLKSD